MYLILELNLLHDKCFSAQFGLKQGTRSINAPALWAAQIVCLCVCDPWHRKHGNGGFNAYAGPVISGRPFFPWPCPLWADFWSNLWPTGSMQIKTSEIDELQGSDKVGFGATRSRQFVDLSEWNWCSIIGTRFWLPLFSMFGFENWAARNATGNCKLHSQDYLVLGMGQWYSYLHTNCVLTMHPARLYAPSINSNSSHSSSALRHRQYTPAGEVQWEESKTQTNGNWRDLINCTTKLYTTIIRTLPVPEAKQIEKQTKMIIFSHCYCVWCVLSVSSRYKS